MADRYWIGGSGTWNSTNTANWSLTSGGVGGASVPTSVDNVIFDDNSGSAGTTITIGASAVVYSLYTTRTMSMSLAGSSNISVYGTLVNSGSSGLFDTAAYLGYLEVYGSNLNMSGQNLWKNIKVKSSAKITSNLYNTTDYIANIVMENASTLIVKENLKVASIQGVASTSYPIIYVGWAGSANKTMTLVGTYPCISGSVQIACLSGGKVIMNGQLGDSGISTSGASVDVLEISPVASGKIFRFNGAVNILQLNRETSSLPFTVQIDPSANVSVGSFNISGDSGTTIKVESSVPGVRAKITKSSGGLVETNYMQVTDMQPAPDNTWISYNSINGGNNWQWYFDNFNKPTSCLFFGSHV